MQKPRFLIKLRDAHAKTGMTAYAVAKKLGLNESTVRKFVTEDVLAEFLPNHVLVLIKFYGLDWQDPSVIEIVDEDEDEPEPQGVLDPA